ncbi:FHA domain-containing protein [Streptomyces uncialis]|uniref:Phosphopeptide-binding protein n=1 Tax=Streptomyces uncialis TaxID=1048205 RepID=A0A1Q4UZQ5_9ACTN|nr:FHA domain-containing protein [Streptomyces uncialis]MCX4663918.1 FHA domain-containing protein [Streptomyces uncialis]OKH91087.1 phosphopeptide-binding protein [Streptomyces uncialis]WTE10919.1 FHA domain-containing protein [Streptomyces uncialis]
MPTCPNGHQSGSDDWCEVCGHRMAGAVPPPPPPSAQGYGYPPPVHGGQSSGSAVQDPIQPEYCPQCHTPRESGAPFCEECRWNFLTNTATSYTPAAPRPPGGGPGPGPAPSHFPPPAGGPPGGPPQASGHDPFGYQGSRPSQVNRPAEPIPPFGGPPGGPPPPPQGGPGAPSAFQQQSGPPAPPAYPGSFPDAGPRQGPPPPPPPGQGFGNGNGDDWVIPPPSGSQHGQHGPGSQHGHGGQHGQGGPGGQGPGGGDHLPYTQPGPGSYQQPANWSATIGPDRDYFLAMMQRSGPEAAGLNLPAYSPEQQRPLIGNQITIGRRRHSTGEVPDIDLSVPPEDPGVSHQHAKLVQQPDGGWAIVDQNSTNGTTVNGSDEPIQPFAPVPLQDGDRVHVGAWTTITIHRG